MATHITELGDIRLDELTWESVLFLQLDISNTGLAITAALMMLPSPGFIQNPHHQSKFTARMPLVCYKDTLHLKGCHTNTLA